MFTSRCFRKVCAVRDFLNLIRSFSLRSKMTVTECDQSLLSYSPVAEEQDFTSPRDNFDRKKMENLLKRRFYVAPAFEIYGGMTGLYDLGPPGTKMKNNIINEWKKYFIFEEKMEEIDCTILTPENVLKASGHVDRFTDFMVKDLKNGECFRLDHLIKAHLEKLISHKKATTEQKTEYGEILIKLDGYSENELSELLKRFDIKSPITGNDLSDPILFNLMFKTQIGPTGSVSGYHRPETAQGIFVNFKRLLQLNGGRLPFAVAQVGKAFRNEISPRTGLIRTREFTIAEIEHFVDPQYKDHPKFSKIENLTVLLYSACDQMNGQPAYLMTIGEAVKKGIIANQTLGYFIGRIYQFLVAIGIKSDKLRFRQHMSNEMAHYATDCWDAEINTSYGWIECVGCADRSCYDLKQHAKATGAQLTADVPLKEPKTIEVMEIDPQMSIIGKYFKKNSKDIVKVLKDMNEEELSVLEAELQSSGEYKLHLGNEEFIITKEMVAVKYCSKSVQVEQIVPAVIEPSFGIERILYAVWEHSFRVRPKDEMRSYFSVPPVIAPIKCCILPLISGNQNLVPWLKVLDEELSRNSISTRINDNRGTIGRRYTHTDEDATPFSITVDFDTLKKPHTVTVRERDSMEQIRIHVDQVASLVQDLSLGKQTWEEAKYNYPKFEKQEAVESGWLNKCLNTFRYIFDVFRLR